MITTVLWIGTAMGAVAGLLHAIQIYRFWAARPETGGTAAALYRGLWAFALWTLFGSYLLILWIVGAVGYCLSLMGAKRKSA